MMRRKERKKIERTLYVVESGVVLPARNVLNSSAPAMVSKKLRAPRKSSRKLRSQLFFAFPLLSSFLPSSPFHDIPVSISPCPTVNLAVGGWNPDSLRALLLTSHA